MAQSTNKLSQFWQELKRRKVTRVITIYAAAAFVILQLVEILAPSLRLPEWTMNFILVLLIVGFIITVIVSWIYDIHPEGGIVKTEHVKKVSGASVPPSAKGWKIASYISFVVIVGLLVHNIMPRTHVKKKPENFEKTIAVLPFQNFSGDPGQDFICEGLTDEIISHLFKIKSFDQVRSLISVSPFKNSDKSTTEIAESLSVNYILQGSYKRMGDKFKITARLIEAKSDNHIWLQDYDLPYKEIVGIPGEVALKIANSLKAFITEDEQKWIELIPTQSNDAYELYLLGRQLINRRSRDSDLWQAIDYFQQAIEKDSAFALAYSGVAETYYQIVNRAILSPREAYPKAKTYSLPALELNNGLAESHLTLGLVRQSFEYDFDEAEKDFIKALEISPGNPVAHQYYALFLSMMGRHDEAISHSNTAIELDPYSLNAESVKYWVLYSAGYKSQTLEMAEQYRDANPDFSMGYWMTVVFYVDLGMYNKALSTNLAVIKLMGEDNISDEIGILGYIYGKLDQIDKARMQINKLEELSLIGEYVDPRAYVWNYLGLNNVEKALEILEQAFNEHTFDPLYLELFPSAIVKNDPGFIELRKKVGLIQ